MTPARRIFAVATAIVITGIASACDRSTQPPMTDQDTMADTAEQVLHDVRSLLTHSGVRRGEMFADTVYVFDDQSRFFLVNVRANFNTEVGAPNGNLRGDRGTYNLRTRVLEGYGNVVVTSTEGKRLVSNHLKYSENTNQISSDSAFTYTEQGRVQRGIGFVSDPNITRFQCMRACSGAGNVPLSNLPDRP